ncbi:MAG TPA: protein-L-isoaspartate(D-aspartate) O-methyltransferase [Candidatus Acidoferrales bacterium]|nr:protein-L-isoaspartate(D-aspartate) O-methyltransferase [Candidatus Acidoferrales bacterium]
MNEPWAAVFGRQRRQMVAEQLRHRGICSGRVLDAMLAIPRHEFVPSSCLADAYSDQALPLGMGQTISQPLIVAAMSAALEPAGTGRVLEVGTGSGYHAAVLSRLADEGFTVEYREELAAAAAERLARLGCRNVCVLLGDGGLGWPAAAPFDAIVVTAAALAVPPPLLDQLAEGGRLVIPLGGADSQELFQHRKRNGRIERRSLDHCRFVPVVGIHGWGRPLRG